MARRMGTGPGLVSVQSLARIWEGQCALLLFCSLFLGVYLRTLVVIPIEEGMISCVCVCVGVLDGSTFGLTMTFNPAARVHLSSSTRAHGSQLSPAPVVVDG